MAQDESINDLDEFAVKKVERYRSLGLIANPFAPDRSSSERGVACEIAAGGNKLLAMIQARSLEEAPKPVWVNKNTEVPTFYPLNAMSHAEAVLATDDSLNVLYAYTPLFTWKIGLVRATLGVIAERLAFRSFPKTLQIYIASVLASPDEELTSYQLLGPDRLKAFAERFSADPDGAVESIFGDAEVERRPELGAVADLRRLSMQEDDEETDTSAEVDASVGDAPGTPQLLAEAAAEMDSDNAAVLDYLVEHTRAHISPVIARGLRVYRDRGLAALSEELRITRAPRKTLAKLVEFANLRYNKVVFIYDSFENWRDIEPDLRSKLVGSLSDLRWKTAGGAFPMLIIGPEEAPELEEAFGHSTRTDWNFDGLLPLQENPDAILPDIVNAWLASAALEGSTPLTLENEVLTKLVELADGSLTKLIVMADVAVESAAERGVSSLDAQALERASEAWS